MQVDCYVDVMKADTVTVGIPVLVRLGCSSLWPLNSLAVRVSP